MKIAIPELEKYEGFNSVVTKQTEDISKLSNQIDEEIKKRIAALGIDINNHDYIKNNFEFIERDGDEFKHLFYIPERKFIISIQKAPTIVMRCDAQDFKDNVITVSASYKYY